MARYANYPLSRCLSSLILPLFRKRNISADNRKIDSNTMRHSMLVLLVATALFNVGMIRSAGAQTGPYSWLNDYNAENSIEKRIPTPTGFERMPAPTDSYAQWLRGLPLKPGKPPVLLHSGEEKRNQDAHCAVVDIDTGKKNLQQCADATMRLRAEYLFSQERHEAIHFNFTSGDRAEWTQWAQGYRPKISGANVRWTQSAKPDSSRASFRRYMNTVFMYAGTLSLSQELESVQNILDMRIGDLLIVGGSPGHCVTVADMAMNPANNRRIYLLAQSYMPAQDIHLLKNPNNADLSPWYALDTRENIITPEWTFTQNQLKRFHEE